MRVIRPAARINALHPTSHKVRLTMPAGGDVATGIVVGTLWLEKSD